MGAGYERPLRNRPGRHRRGGEPLVEHVDHRAEAPARRLSLPAPSPSSLVGIAVLVLIAAGAIHLGSAGSAVPLEERSPVSMSETADPSPAAGGSSGDATTDEVDSQPPSAHDPDTSLEEASGTAGGERAEDQAPSEIVVHVSGAVENPGVVRLEPGARVQDAVDAAGGAAPEADLAAVNLARPVADGEQIHLPLPGEEPPPAAAPELGQAPGTGGSPGSGASGTSRDVLIDINTANASQLEELPGVGPAIAQRIIDHREANGPFRSVDDLMEVSGIGPATLEKIRDQATVSG